GRALWWSGRGDVAAPALTRDLDLRAVKTATLTYAAWYDVEDGYDYGYVELSSDGGQTWTTLAAPGTTAANPNGNNLGHGYTAHSGGGSDSSVWVQERVDLSPYAGKAVQLRFQYVTDDGYNADGFALDDIAVPEIGYRDDAETPGANGWRAQGWVHVTPTLPERFVVQIITYAANGTSSVTVLPLDAANHGSLTLPTGSSGRTVLVVAPLAPQTTQVGHYRVVVR
ncbi:MAG: immune inhibitor A, partial [Chloroflexota bacterium]|nr:immune inhibitor A [Chloroflexota bacterium]